ncbi:hypothetical protein QTP70_033147 [Hemibagrus guttatus]|uniref:SEA domain-containing protein n=1 Tax=Hemibagrus guttatus TaxID=175788 RepID=A0AAE0RGU0_9TELE|nr:hypothetical protein QTP70_033147 [Hemibagrus guttatus]
MSITTPTTEIPTSTFITTQATTTTAEEKNPTTISKTAPSTVKGETTFSVSSANPPVTTDPTSQTTTNEETAFINTSNEAERTPVLFSTAAPISTKSHPTNTATSKPTATLSDITGSAVVQTRIVFSSSSPVPNESLVLSVTQTLLSARLTNLTDSVKVLNFTYEKISDTSYAVNFTFNISNLSMTQNPDLRNDTYSQVETIINNALNTLLNEAGAEPFEAQSSFFTSSGNQVNGNMTYHFQDGDTKTPAAFLNELKAQSTPM